MAGQGVSVLIIFIASLLVAGAVSGTMTDTVMQVSESLSEQGDQVSKSIQTEVEIISDSGSGAVYNDSTGEVTLLVKNTGTRQLHADSNEIDVLIDGKYVRNKSVEVVSSPEWKSGDVARIKFNTTLASGDHSTSVIVNSDREDISFYV